MNENEEQETSNPSITFPISFPIDYAQAKTSSVCLASDPHFSFFGFLLLVLGLLECFFSFPTMCYFDHTRWSCGYWKWGNFRQQCNKEHRIGETCGLKLVYFTAYETSNCKICDVMSRKHKKASKLEKDIERWQKEGNRPASIEKAQQDIANIQSQVASLRNDHQQRKMSIS